MQERNDERRVVVIGGGLAGLAAAIVLAERGRPVTMMEAEAFVGGRAGAWGEILRDGSQVQMERGFHAFFRNYANVRALLRRIDPDLRSLAPMDDYPILGPDGARESFSGLPTRTPFNVLELVRRSRHLGLADLPRVSVRRALAMLTYDGDRTFARWDRATAREYLDSLRFPPAARQMLFDVFAHSFFNDEDEYSAAELLAMFHFYFLGNPEGLVFDTMRAPFSTALFEPLVALLESLGGQVHRSTRVERLEVVGQRVRVHARGRVVEGSDAILAVHLPGLKSLVRSSPQCFPPTLRARIDRLAVARPFAVWRLYLDRPVRADRGPFVGTTGVGILDNISVYEKLETESRAWAESTKGSVVELHAYAVDPTWTEAEIRDDLLRGLHAIYPETREASIIDSRFLLRQDCPAFRPGDYALRPTVSDVGPQVHLAGDYVRLPFPSALMERAVASGFLAANRVLEREGKRGVEVAAPGRRGMLAPFARWIHGR